MKHLGRILMLAAICVGAFAQGSGPATNTARTNLPAVGGRQSIDRGALDVTPEQRAKIDQINRAYATNMTPALARLASARREIESMVNQEKFDEAGVRAKAKEIADMEAEIAIARAGRYAKFRAFLTPEQARRFNTGAPISRPFMPTLHDAPIAPAK